ncbi:MAG: GNAT family N-acetyltransferase [Anaerolineaceae bacterium]
MREKIIDKDKITAMPLTMERWEDFHQLFGSHGAMAGCWCMWWRMKRSDFSRTSGEEKKNCMLEIVKENRQPGILGYLENKPIAWCSIAPRNEFPSLDRSRVLGRVDDQPVWSMVCFYFSVGYRRSGLMQKMIELGVDFARQRGAGIIESYPVDPHRKISSGEIFTGLASIFQKAGFVEVARRSPTRPIMRLIQ